MTSEHNNGETDAESSGPKYIDLTDELNATHRNANARYLRSILLTGLTEVADLRQRMIDFIEYMTVSQQAAVSLGNLSRRYATPAKRLGASFAELLGEMQAAGSIRVFPVKRGSAVVFGDPEAQLLPLLLANLDNRKLLDPIPADKFQL